MAYNAQRKELKRLNIAIAGEHVGARCRPCGNMCRLAIWWARIPTREDAAWGRVGGQLVTIRILVVEDVASTRKVVVEHLRRQGYVVAEAADGQSGLESAVTTPPDVIITDLEMPRLDGLGLLRAVQKHQPDCPAIVLSAHEDLTHILGALRQGVVYDYLIKPVDPDLLDLAVERALEVRTLRAKARELEQVTAMRQLAMTAGDQILNPLSTIPLAIHLLQKKPTPDTITLVIQKLEKMSDRISAAITRMSKIHRYAPEHVAGNLWQINLDEATAPVGGEEVSSEVRPSPTGASDPAGKASDVVSLLDPRLAWVAGDQTFLEDLLSLFLREAADFRDTLRTAVAAGDGNAIQNAAHRLKGSLANFGAPATAVKELAAQLERVGTHQQYAEASEIFGQLDTPLQALIEKVRTLHAEVTGDARR